MAVPGEKEEGPPQPHYQAFGGIHGQVYRGWPQASLGMGVHQAVAQRLPLGDIW